MSDRRLTVSPPMMSSPDEMSQVPALPPRGQEHIAGAVLVGSRPDSGMRQDRSEAECGRTGHRRGPETAARTVLPLNAIVTGAPVAVPEARRSARSARSRSKTSRSCSTRRSAEVRTRPWNSGGWNLAYGLAPENRQRALLGLMYAGCALGLSAAVHWAGRALPGSTGDRRSDLG